MASSGTEHVSRRRFLKIAFGIAVAAAVALTARAIFRVIYFRRHADDPIQGWMPLRYVARMRGVRLDDLRSELGLDADLRDRLTIDEIAAQIGISSEQLIQRIEDALERLQSKAGSAP